MNKVSSFKKKVSRGRNSLNLKLGTVNFFLFLFAVIPTSDGLLVMNPLNVSGAVSIDDRPIILLSGESVLVGEATTIRSGVVGVEIIRSAYSYIFILFLFSFFVIIGGVFFLVWGWNYAK